MSDPFYIMSEDSVTVYFNGLPDTIDKTHQNFDAVIKEIRNENWDAVEVLINIPRGVERYSKGNIQIINSEFYFKGHLLTDYLCDRIISMLDDGMNIDLMVAYFENLMENPDPRARADQFKWIEKGKMPITNDGYIVAYKKVRGDLKSYHNGKWVGDTFHPNQYYSHNIGDVCEMPRDKCNSNPNETCSDGLHFCSFSYLESYCGDKTVMLKIHPRDIVSIPTDYNFAKARCCRYEVLQVMDSKDVYDVLGGKRVVRAQKGMSLSEFGQEVMDFDDPETSEVPDDEPVNDDDENIDDMFVADEDAFVNDEDEDDDDFWNGEDEEEPTELQKDEIVKDMQFVCRKNNKTYNGEEIRALITKHGSQRAIERHEGIPRTTLQSWIEKIEERLDEED